MQTSGRGPGAPGSRKPMGIQFVKATDSKVEPLSVKKESAEGGSSGMKQENSQEKSFGGPGNVSTGTSSSPKPLLSLPVKGSFQASPQQNAINGGPRFGNPSGAPYRFGGAGGRGGFTGGKDGQGFGLGSSNRMPLKGGSPVGEFRKVQEAKPFFTKQEYYKLWKIEKDAQIEKFRKLAFEVMALKTDRPNAIDKLNSASNRVPIRIEFNTEPVITGKTTNHFISRVFIDTVTVATGEGARVKDAKANAYEAALQAVLLPHMRIVQLDPNTRELQTSKEEFTGPPRAPSRVPLPRNVSKIAPSCRDNPQNPPAPGEIPSQHKETNVEVACLKRRFNEYKPLEDFVIVEPKIPIPDCTPAHTLRRSADFNHMLLEYEYFFKGDAARCVLKLENQTLADVNTGSKVSAKNMAAHQALRKLKKMCWIIKTKQAVDSDSKISKEEMLNELNDMNENSDVITDNNIGHKMLQKMGWSGGGVGKDGTGIAEPVSLKSVLNREGLGLSATKGITEEFRRCVREVIENYASSQRQDDLVFSSDFRLDERQIIHDECRRLNLKSKSRGKGIKRYLCVRRKRSAFQLFDHIMSCGGETARYQLVPPGCDTGDGGKCAPMNAGNSSLPGMGSGNPGGTSWEGQGGDGHWNGPGNGGGPGYGPNGGDQGKGPNGGQWNGPNGGGQRNGSNGGGQWNGQRNEEEQWNGPNREGQWNGPDRGGQWNGQRNDPNGGGRWNNPRNGSNGGQWNGPNDGGQWNGPNGGGQWNGPNGGGQWNGPNNGGQWNGPNGGGPRTGPGRGGYNSGPNNCSPGNGPNNGGPGNGPNNGSFGNGPNNGGPGNGPNNGGPGNGPNNGGPGSGPNNGGPGNGPNVGAPVNGPNNGGPGNGPNGNSQGNFPNYQGPGGGGFGPMLNAGQGQPGNGSNAMRNGSQGNFQNGGSMGQNVGHSQGGGQDQQTGNNQGQKQGGNMRNSQGPAQIAGNFQGQGQNMGSHQGWAPNMDNFQGPGQNMSNFQGQGPNMGNFQGQGQNMGNFQGQGQNMSNFQGQGQNMGNFQGQGPNMGNFQGQGPNMGNIQGQGPNMGNFQGQGPSMGNFQGQSPSIGNSQGPGNLQGQRQGPNMGNFQGQNMGNFQGQNMGNFQGQGPVPNMGNFQGQGQNVAAFQGQGQNANNYQGQNQNASFYPGQNYGQWQGQNPQNFQGQDQMTVNSQASNMANLPAGPNQPMGYMANPDSYQASAYVAASYGQGVDSYYQTDTYSQTNAQQLTQAADPSQQYPSYEQAAGSGVSGVGGSIQGSAVYYSTSPAGPNPAANSSQQSAVTTNTEAPVAQRKKGKSGSSKSKSKTTGGQQGPRMES